MSGELRVNIPEEALDFLRRLRFEAEGLRVLCLQLARMKTAKNQWEKRYTAGLREARQSYSFALEALAELLLPEGEGTVQADFLTGELVRKAAACETKTAEFS